MLYQVLFLYAPNRVFVVAPYLAFQFLTFCQVLFLIQVYDVVQLQDLYCRYPREESGSAVAGGKVIEY